MNQFNIDNINIPFVYNRPDEFIPGKTSIYYSGPYWNENEMKAAIETLLNGKWITAGEKTFKFERQFSKKFKVKHSLMVNSGSSANLVLMNGLKIRFGWEDDDEIIVSPVGFATTISVIYQNRLKPVFVDIEWDTLNFNVDEIESKITNKTRGIDEKYLNEYYVAFSNSFYPAHHISTGEGGMVCTNDDELIKIMRSLAWWGRDCYCVGSANLLSCGTCGRRFDKWLDSYHGDIDHKYVFSNMGYNLKPLDLQGAIGIEQLNKFDEIETNRKVSKKTLEKIFIDNIEGISAVKTLEKSDVSWFGTPFICENYELKSKLVEFLEENKIQTRNYFAGNILIHPGYKFLDDYTKYPEANKVLDKVFFIGASPHYNQEIFNYIESVVKKFK